MPKRTLKKLSRRCLLYICLLVRLIGDTQSIAVQQQARIDRIRGKPPYQPTTNFIPTERKKSSYFLPGMRHMFPVQRFRGPPVQPSKRLPPVDDLTLMQGNKSDTLQNMSESSRFLLDKYASLDEIEKRNLKMKIDAEARASQPLNAEDDLHIMYVDQHICVVNKPSGVLSVPGRRRNPSLANLVHDLLSPEVTVDQMIVHRIDMDTSGILVFALTELALSQLHNDFRRRQVKKTYEALLAGHLKTTSQVEIDLALERDPFHPPFMRIAKTGNAASRPDIDQMHPSFRKFISQAPKPSLSELSVISYEDLDGIPVTRVALSLHTGRTHQLRVHCAAIGFPIVGDDIYGLGGEGDCGVSPESLDGVVPNWMETQEELLELNSPLCLHAKRLCLYHPFSGAAMEFESRPAF